VQAFFSFQQGFARAGLQLDHDMQQVGQTSAVMYLLILAVCALLLLGALGVVVLACRSSSDGYEDAAGFHAETADSAPTKCATVAKPRLTATREIRVTVS
jgi:hypothetical protein